MINKIRGLIQKVDLLLLVTVILPTAASILYFGIFASDVYISESRFVVRSPEKPATSSLGIMLKSAGFTNASDEVYAAKDFITSRDALSALNKGDAIKSNYSRQSISLFDRYAPFGYSDNFEDLYRYFGKKIAVEYDATSSITTLTVQAYSAQDARNINEGLLEQAEGLVNHLNERGRKDLIQYANAEVDAAGNEATRAAIALAKYRDQKGVIDPEKQATVQLQMISKLQDELISVRNQRDQLQATVPQNSQIQSLNVRIDDLTAEIAKQSGYVAGGSGSLSATAIEFQRLALQRELADKRLATALSALEDARNEARRKQAYVERIVQPNLPEKALEPRRVRGIFATFILGLVAWGVLGMLLAGMREHRD